jgi:hypothetical protein
MEDAYRPENIGFVGGGGDDATRGCASYPLSLLHFSLLPSLITTTKILPNRISKSFDAAAAMLFYYFILIYIIQVNTSSWL